MPAIAGHGNAPEDSTNVTIRPTKRPSLMRLYSHRSTLRLLLVGMLLVLGTSQASPRTLPEGYPDTARRKVSLDQGWRFHLGDISGGAQAVDFPDQSWESINVPHTFKLTSLTLDGVQDDKFQKSFQREIAWYRRTFTVDPSGGSRIYLEFEGAHQVTDLWVNGQHVGQHAVGGYTPFDFDLTDFVRRDGPNTIALRLDNTINPHTPPDPGPFDYVKFGGLYRDVYLVQTDPVHIPFNWESLHSGLTITTPSIDPVNRNATIDIKTSVRNESTQTATCELVSRVIDQEGIVVLRLVETATLPPGVEREFDQIGSLEDNVHFWDTGHPYLYRVNSLVRIAGNDIDCVENRIGLRKFELDHERGFLLNQRPIKLVGFNRHQHYAYIGDALPDSLHYKDMLQFKEFGFNAMRTAHYPQDNAILDACDELGILVYEEAPTWISISKDPLWWKNFEQAARVMVRNHRNHPSVIMWGAGINHRGYVPMAHNTIKQEDPVRLTASQGSRWTGWQASGLADINANMLYGPFIWDRSEPIFAMEGGQGPLALAPIENDPLMLGLLSWTAHAYYTFHSEHAKARNPLDRTRGGAMTIFRYPRPELAWYKAELHAEPCVSIREDWNQPTSTVTIYSNGIEVELSLNGQAIARTTSSPDPKFKGLAHPPFVFEGITYQPGKLMATARFADGTTLFATRQTALEPYAIRLDPDMTGRKFVADGSDIVVVYAQIVDRNGVTVTGARSLVRFTVVGDATVVGDNAGINANPMFPEYGVAPALIRAGKTAGVITLRATAEGLQAGEATLVSVPFEPDVIKCSARPIHDFRHVRVDMGAADQLTQFGWDAWDGTDNQPSTHALAVFGLGVSVQVAPASPNGVIRWLGEMNVIGKYGYAYGDGALVLDPAGLNLTFRSLPAGVYKLTTWHHAPQSNSDSMDPNRDKLRTLTLNKLPHATSLTIRSDAQLSGNPVTATVTEGKEMQKQEPGTAEMLISADGVHPIIINFQGTNGPGVWLNAFELTEWSPALPHG